jgi:hypothetical protein
MFRTQHTGHNYLLSGMHINRKVPVIIHCTTLFWNVSVSYDRHN